MDSPCFFGVLLLTLAIKLRNDYFSVWLSTKPPDSHFLLSTAQTMDDEKPNYTEIYWILNWFLYVLLYFVMLNHNMLTFIISLNFVLAATNLIKDFYFTFNSSKRFFKGFLALGLFVLYWCVESYQTFSSKPFSSGDHGCFQNGFIVLLIIKFNCIFVQNFNILQAYMFINHNVSQLSFNPNVYHTLF